MAVNVKCPRCAASYRVGNQSLGRQARCKGCGQTFTVQMAADPTLQAHRSPAQASQPSKSVSAQGFPETIVQYQVRRKLGGGGMGEVWLAFDPDLEREVAIKTLRAELAGDPEYGERFLREARSAAKLHHPHTATVFQVGREGPFVYLVMEYLPGGSLEQQLAADGPLDWREAALAIRDATAGLATAHHIGLVHRDVKPGNLIRSADGQVKMADFGLARARNQSAQITQQGALVGTPAYMAPELWQGGTADARSDLYSLVCTFFHLLTGRVPFDGETTVAIGYQHCHQPLPDLRQLSPGLPDGIYKVVNKGLRKAPSDRYQTAEALLEDLNELLTVPGTGHAVFSTPPPLPISTQTPLPVPSSDRRQTFIEQPGSAKPPSTTAPPLGTRGVQRTMLEQPKPRQVETTMVVPPNQAPALGEALPQPRLIDRVPTEIKKYGLALVIAVGVLILAVLSWTSSTRRSGLEVTGRGSEPNQETRSAPQSEHDQQEDTQGRIEQDHAPVQTKTISKPSASTPSRAPQRPIPVPGTGADSAPPPLAVAPFDAAAAKSHQEAWAEYLGVPDELTNSIGMRLRLIPPGEFMMGSPKQEIEELIPLLKDVLDEGLPEHLSKEMATTLGVIALKNVLNAELPHHRVRITKPYYLGMYEVTQSEYERVMRTNPSAFSGTGSSSDKVTGQDTGRFPVEGVSWEEAVEFCRRLSALPEERAAGRVYRLPTEAEWEFACRAGTTTPFHFGSQLSGREANCNGNRPYGTTTKGTHLERPTTVGSYAANAFGLYDMHGNVWEWCSDWFDTEYYANSPTDDPTGPTSGSHRVNRGGGWNAPAGGCRSAYRWGVQPSVRDSLQGFRLAFSSLDAEGPEDPMPSLAKTETPSEPDSSVPAKSTQSRVWTDSTGQFKVEAELVSVFADRVTLKRVTDGQEVSLRIKQLSAADQQYLHAEERGEANPPPLAVAPFNATAAKSHQEAWSEYLSVPIEITNSIGIKLAFIPAGEFLMGSPDSDSDANDPEKPQHRVRITEPFYLGVTEVTQEQYERVMGMNPSRFKGAQLPVENVSWEDAVEFCRKLSALPAERSAGRVYRLSTEAEWEYACRAGSKTTWSFGDDESSLGEYAWYKSNSGRTTQPVGTKKPNAWGLYDMHGNVWEWHSDWFGSGYYTESPVDDPTGPTAGSYRVRRGGGWDSHARFCRSVGRGRDQPSFRGNHLGFRLAFSSVEASDRKTENSALPKMETLRKPRSSTASNVPQQTVPATARCTDSAPPLAVAPFDAAAAKSHQEAWSEYLSVPMEMTNSIGMKLVLIPPGEYMMGSLGSDWDARSNEKPQHRVRITRAFYLGVYPVTQSQWQSVMGSNPNRFKEPHHPVENVRWRDCQEFIRRLNERRGERNGVYRLPTEAEWEYACRAGSTTVYSFGESAASLSDYAWYRDNSGGSTHPVGQKLPNAWGLYDMHGNVWEWCSDWYEGSYNANSPLDDPTGPLAGSVRVSRGGSWDDGARNCRSAFRNLSTPSWPLDSLGFRLAFSSVDESGQ